MAWTNIRFCKSHIRCSRKIIVGLSLYLLTLNANAALSLAEAISSAQRNDPWLEGSVHQQGALSALSTAAGTLPDPSLSLGLANLPIDTFNFDQEAMTQLIVGVAQTLPRGDSLKLKQQQLTLLGSQHPHLREDRKARVAVNVSHLWLETYQATETIRLIEQDRELFEHLVDVAESSYSSAMGKTRQQDLIRAQLELTRLEDRLNVLHERLEMSRARLAQWLLPRSSGAADQWQYQNPQRYQLTPKLPALQLDQTDLFSNSIELSAQTIASALISHPAILNLDAKIAASATGIQIAKQQYKPEWKLNASYGYRDDAPDGMDRADFFSIGVAVDLPLFTSNRQDQQVQSAAATTESVRTERALLMRKMVATFATQRSRLIRLDERRTLYQTRLLNEIHEQAEASLTAYTNDDGDFSEVVRSRIDELNVRIDAFNIDIDRLKTIAELNYFFAQSEAPLSGEQQ